ALGAVNSSVGPLVGYLRMQEGISNDSFLNLWLGLRGKRICHDREVLRGSRRQLRERRRMERLGITAAQGHRADVLRIQRLPPDRYFRLLRIIRGVLRRDRREQSRRQHCRGVVAIPFLALGKIHFEAVERGEVPCRAGKGHPHFLVNCPDVAVHLEALAIRRANRVKSLIQRIPITGESRRVVLTADRKRYWTGREIEQVTVKGGIVDR